MGRARDAATVIPRSWFYVAAGLLWLAGASRLTFGLLVPAVIALLLAWPEGES